MATVVEKTFHSLAATANPHAVEVLIHSLDVPHPKIQAEALKGILNRGGTPEFVECVRRYPTASSDFRKTLESSSDQLTHALKQCVLNHRGPLTEAAFEFMRLGEAYQLFETLLDNLINRREALYEESIEALRYFVNRLTPTDSRERKRGSSLQVRNPRDLVLKHLEVAVSGLAKMTHQDLVMEAVFALAEPKHPLVYKLLSYSQPDLRELAVQILFESRHPGVIGLLLSSLETPQPSGKVLDAIRVRTDPEFVLACLRWVPRKWTAVQERNLRRLTYVTWLSQEDESLEIIPEELHLALHEWVAATGVDRETKSRIRKWLVSHGSAEARTVAIESMDDRDHEAVQEIVLESLESEDPDVQAWATSQLRSQHVPDAIQKLIERLDSPELCVQTVARQELSGFDLDCLLDRFESLTPQARENAAQLLAKIDPHWQEHLTLELQHSIRRRRLRAIRGTLAYGWQHEMLPILLNAAQDSDNHIRRTVVEVLGHVRDSRVIALLLGMREDPSERVQETVNDALRQLAEQEKSAVSPPDIPVSHP